MNNTANEKMADPVFLRIAEELIETAWFDPAHVSPFSAWAGHIPFASWIVRQARPSALVELGTHHGTSYFSFCQTVKDLGLKTHCHAVDTWEGDEHAGFYGSKIYESVQEHNQSHYSDFSELLRMTFDEANDRFLEKSIDLLHIDGLHTYEAIKHDFETWLPKVAPGGIVLFHDTHVRVRGFGVWKLWEELIQEYPNHLDFFHSHGLGVLQLNDAKTEQKLPWLDTAYPGKEKLTHYFAALGRLHVERCEREMERMQQEKKEKAALEAAEAAKRLPYWRKVRTALKDTYRIIIRRKQQ